MNVKGEKDKNMRNKGITLIALVITIIVLLILAAVSIATLTGQNGILTRANDAKEDTARETAKEKVAVEVLGSYGNDGKLDYGLLEENLNNIKGIQGVPNPITDASFPIKVTVDGYEVTIEKSGNVTVGDKNNNPPQTGTALDQAKDESMLTKDTDTDVTVTDGTVTIPAKFQVAEDSGNTIDEGIVIEDKDSNQFVWVPVSKENFDTEFVRRAGYYDGTLQDMTNYGEANIEGINVDIDGTETGVIESATTVQEAKLMYASVKRNGGFYIGRYEAGTTNKREYGDGIEDSVLVQKGKNVYNYVGWSHSDDMSVDTGGAVELARNFDTANEYETVTSTLCYGVQWDAIMRWMKDVPNLTGGKYVEDSTGMGWYKDNYSNDSNGNPGHKTGIDVNGGKNKVKNIYDLAGNVYEWTMESYITFYRAYRGGNHLASASVAPASYRGSNSPSPGYNGDFGFRVTLFLNSPPQYT